MNKICQRQLLIEYLFRYRNNLPDERMLEMIDMDVIDKFREEVIVACEQVRADFTKRGDINNVFYK
jgi:hypothetical protein